jgi:hypothetical protein
MERNTTNATARELTGMERLSKSTVVAEGYGSRLLMSEKEMVQSPCTKDVEPDASATPVHGELG